MMLTVWLSFQWSEPRMNDMNYANANFNSGAIPVA